MPVLLSDFVMQCPRKSVCGKYPSGCKECGERPDVGIIVEGEKTPVICGRVYKLVSKPKVKSAEEEVRP